MALPSDFLESLQYPAVTNARASDDYGAGGNNWMMAGTSLLLSAVGLRASKDNFWSSNKQTDRGRESSPVLQAVVCALSQGPVGFADPLYYTDPAVLWPTMNQDGTLLHPSRPATTVDGQFEERSEWVGSDVRVASSTILSKSTSRVLYYYSILVAGSAALTVPNLLTAMDLWPFVPQEYPYWLWQYNNTACSTLGAKAVDCIHKLVPSHDSIHHLNPTYNPLQTLSGDAVKWTLWTCVPVFASGYVLLGEIDKYVAISPDRFVTISPTDMGIDIVLRGAAKESVNVAYVNPKGTIMVESIKLDTQGIALAVLT